MCDRPINIVHTCNVKRNTYVPSTRENILDNAQNYLKEKKKPLYNSSTTFNIKCNNHLNNSCKSKDKISLHDLRYVNEHDHLYREPWSSFVQEKSSRECSPKNIVQPALDVHVARHSNRPSKLKRYRPKRRCKRQYRDVAVPIKRDTSKTICGRSIDSNIENFANYLENYTSKDTSKMKLSNLLSKDCPNCGLSQSCSVNVSNNDLEAYTDPNAYSNNYGLSYDSNVASCENCGNFSRSSLIKKYPETCDWSMYDNFRTIDSMTDLHGCCCSRNTRENEIQSHECTPSKASLFVETGGSVIDLSRCSSSYSDLPNTCVCSKESPAVEESLTMIKDIVQDRSYENEERVMFDECKIRCKSREHEPGTACCSHFIPKERYYSGENATWNQLETVESKAQRPDCERRENIQRRNASTCSTIRSIDKRPRCYESKTKCVRTDIKKGSEENGIPQGCQSSLFGNFEIGKVWSQIHGGCKNLIQSAITNVGQAIKDMSKSKDTLGDCKENEIPDPVARSSSCNRTCQRSYRRVHGDVKNN